MNKKINNFINLYNESVEENLGEVKKELQEAGIDTDALKKNILQMIKCEEAELKKEQGRNFRKEFLKEMEREEDGLNKKYPAGNSEFRLAARNADENERVENTVDDEVKLRLIEKIKKEKFDNGAGSGKGS